MSSLKKKILQEIEKILNEQETTVGKCPPEEKEIGTENDGTPICVPKTSADKRLEMARGAGQAIGQAARTATGAVGTAAKAVGEFFSGKTPAAPSTQPVIRRPTFFKCPTPGTVTKFQQWFIKSYPQDSQELKISVDDKYGKNTHTALGAYFSYNDKSSAIGNIISKNSLQKPGLKNQVCQALSDPNMPWNKTEVTPTNATETSSVSALAESKSWIDRTREETTYNLFERLVKDASKKVI